MSVPGRRHPFQVFIAFFATVTAFSLLILGPSPGSVILAALGPTLVYVWAACLLGGGGLLLLAAAAPERSSRWRVIAFWSEYVAHPIFAFSSLTYAFPILSVWPRGAFSGAILLGMAMASATRWFFIEKTRRGAISRIENENNNA